VVKNFCIYQDNDDKKTILLNLAELETSDAEAYLEKYLIIVLN
jgi:hypothetical protein